MVVIQKRIICGHQAALTNVVQEVIIHHKRKNGFGAWTGGRVYYLNLLVNVGYAFSHARVFLNVLGYTTVGFARQDQTCLCTRLYVLRSRSLPSIRESTMGRGHGVSVINRFSNRIITHHAISYA